MRLAILLALCFATAAPAASKVTGKYDLNGFDVTNYQNQRFVSELQVTAKVRKGKVKARAIVYPSGNKTVVKLIPDRPISNDRRRQSVRLSGLGHHKQARTGRVSIISIDARGKLRKKSGGRVKMKFIYDGVGISGTYTGATVEGEASGWRR